VDTEIIVAKLVELAWDAAKAARDGRPFEEVDGYIDLLEMAAREALVRAAQVSIGQA
jgi:hypothetical protein